MANPLITDAFREITQPLSLSEKTGMKGGRPLVSHSPPIGRTSVRPVTLD